MYCRYRQSVLEENIPYIPYWSMEAGADTSDGDQHDVRERTRSQWDKVLISENGVREISIPESGVMSDYEVYSVSG